MASFEDVKERFKSEANQLWEKIQESSAYHRVKDRFENLSPMAQKALLASVALVIFLAIMSFPMSSFWSGSDSLATYEAQRGLIRDLFKVQQDSQGNLGMDPAPPVESLKSRIDDTLRQLQLLPEQITGVGDTDLPSNIPKDRIDGSLKVALSKLNVRQIVDVGHQIASIHPAMKMVDLLISANSQDPKYFDVVYKFITLKIPIYIPPPPEEDPAEKTKKGSKTAKKSTEPKAGADE